MKTDGRPIIYQRNVQALMGRKWVTVIRLKEWETWDHGLLLLKRHHYPLDKLFIPPIRYRFIEQLIEVIDEFGTGER